MIQVPFSQSKRACWRETVGSEITISLLGSRPRVVTVLAICTVVPAKGPVRKRRVARPGELLTASMIFPGSFS
jgi:hypothetical protein